MPLFGFSSFNQFNIFTSCLVSPEISLMAIRGKGLNHLTL